MRHFRYVRRNVSCGKQELLFVQTLHQKLHTLKEKAKKN